MRRDLLGTLGDLPELQRGVLSRRQALDIGMTGDLIKSMLRSGRWRQLHRGVYATFTGEPCRAAMQWAVVLRAGQGAVLSHHTAAELDGLAWKRSAVIHVSVPAERRVAAIPGVMVHRSERVAEARHPSLLPPRTRIEETVLDLTQVSDAFDDAFEWLCRACGGRLTTPQRLASAMAVRKKLRWRGSLAAALDEVAGGVHSGLEYRYVRDVERPHGLPRGTRQARSRRSTRSEYRDSLYEEYRIIVETDGRAAHPEGARWRDIRRDNAAAADGFTTLRYNWADVTTQPCRVAAEIGATLRKRGWHGTPHRCGPGCAVQFS
jgi:hypothetical protein